MIALDPRNPAHRFFLPKPGYAAFAGLEHAEICRSELAALAVLHPLAFVNQDGWGMVAITGIAGFGNLYLDDGGRWLSDYVPADVRRFPFARVSRSGLPHTHIDAGCGCLADAGSGRRLFTDDAEPTDELRRIEAFLDAFQSDLDATRKAAAALDELALLEPWPLAARTEDADIAMEGYWRVSAGALSRLAGQDALRLWSVGGAWLAHAQLLSMRNIASLSKLCRLKVYARGMASEARDGPDDDSFDFAMPPQPFEAEE